MMTNSFLRSDSSKRSGAHTNGPLRVQLLGTVALAFLGLASHAHAELRDYTVRWLPSESSGVEGYELSVTPVGGGSPATFDLGRPAQQSGELRYGMELEDSVDLQLRLRAYAGTEFSPFSNEIVVAKSTAPGEPTFGVSNVSGATGVVSGEIVVLAETFGSVASVEFALDGTSYRIENAVPWSMQGDAGEPGTEYGFDTTALADGEHTIEAVGFSGANSSGTRGATTSVQFFVDNSIAPPPTPTPDPPPTPTPVPPPTPDPTPVPPSGPQGAIAGLIGDPSGDLVALRVDGSTDVLMNHALVAGGDLRPVWCDLDGDADRDLVLGFGAGSEAQLLLAYVEDGIVVGNEVIYAAKKRQRTVNTGTWPSCGDTDGDGLNELAVGLGAGSMASIALIDDQTTQYKFMKGNYRYLLRSLISTTMFGMDYARNGAAKPVLADIDGDGRAEVIVGRSEGGQGTISIFDDALTGFKIFPGLGPDLGLVEVVGDAAYHAADGSTEVSAGDIDGDGLAEIVVATRVAGGSRLYIHDDAERGFAPLVDQTSGLEFGHGGAGADLGVFESSLADIDGDGLPEIAIGYGEGQIQLFDDLLTQFAPLIWTGDAEGIVRAPDATAPIASALEASP